MAYIYGLRAKDADSYFYIGSTKHTLEHRLRQHLDMIRLGRNKNRHLVHTVNKIGAENICIEVIEICGELERFNREYVFIQAALEQGVKLTNIIYNQRDFEAARAFEESAEYELIPRHIEGLCLALEGKTTRNGDSLHDRLADLLDELSWYLVRKFPNEYMAWIAEVVPKHYEPEEAERQTANFCKRISEVLERDGSGAESRLLG